MWTIIGVVIAAVTVIITAVQWMISNAFKKGAISQKVDDVHEKIKSYNGKTAECEKRFIQLEDQRNKSIKIENKIDSINTSIAYMLGNMDVLLRAGNIPSPIQSQSPVSLTDIGKKLAEKMDIEARISNNRDKIYAFLDSNIPSPNAYDIQQFCIEMASVYPERFFSEDDVIFIKNFAYSDGKPLVYYGGMIGVMIRDAYLKHKGISTSEIDKGKY
jgi:hypothetical protein